MKITKLFFFVSLSLLLVSCGSSRKTTEQKSTTKNISKKAKDIVSYANTFKGTKYKFGGTTKKGMDCSGLIYTSFKREGINLPRVSRDMATQGNKISLKNTHKGDLVFFRTNKNRKAINHVGLVLENKKGELFFIHATTSQGVIITSLEEKYWKSAFVEARRVL